MTQPDEARIQTVQEAKPLFNALPGEPLPYYVANGEGLRFERDGQLWTIIARAGDTGGSFDAAFIRGPRGTGAAAHSLPRHQRSYYVFEGQVQVWLPGRSRVLGPGDSVHVPEGTPIAYRLLGHLSKLLLFSAPGGALDELISGEDQVEHHLYPAGAAGTTTDAGLALPPLGSVAQGDLELLGADDAWDADLPEGNEPYMIRGLEGDRRGWPDSLNAFSSRGRTTGGRYFSVATLGAPAPYIIRHFHQLHTENFFCLSGRIWLWVNGEEILLTAGDYVHAPAGTVHSFAFAAHQTRMLGVLTGNVFEPFFDVTGVDTEDHVYTEGLIDPSVVIGGIKANPDLDLVVTGPPPERTRAPGL
ncbi:cupin domain-containing protein [Kocuria soli]|uniref:cupin domain-containing protein n=1 Tax=Kocuria soli TaxID=2485125 RepID=UPI0018F3614D|nr:cupin domain-containing protein [Kocuria soli]